VASPLDRYFEAIDRGDPEATTAAFTDDAVYVRPSLDRPGALESYRGRDELLDYFRRRGKLPFRHEVRTCSVEGGECFAEGLAYVEDEPKNSFLVHATIAPDGRIARYFALMADAVER
jgi:ketosteroid isomerase-like protein